MIPVQTATLPLPPVDRKEVLRYAGAKAETPDVARLLEDCLTEAQSILTGRVCWSAFPVSVQRDALDLGFVCIPSVSLRQVLAGCDWIVVFAATIGVETDRLISRYGRISPAKSLLFQAIGTERIETLCDIFCEKIQTDTGLSPAPRFSPGYGDLPLALQTDIFRILDCHRKIGLTLNDSLLMSPSKSVTAIVGLRPCPLNIPAGCSRCKKTDCLYRRLP